MSEASQRRWKSPSAKILWLKLKLTIKTARLRSLKQLKYEQLQEEALLKNGKDGPVILPNDRRAQGLLNYTPEALTQRFNLRNHPDVIKAVQQLWSVELPRDAMGCIDRRGYASLFRRIGRSLESNVTKQRLRRIEKTIQEDWSRDNKGEEKMSFATFFDSVFELADLWCDTIDADEYAAFLRKLVMKVTTIRRKKHDLSDRGTRILRALKQVKDINTESSSDDERISSDEQNEASAGDSDDHDNKIDLPAHLTLPSHSTNFVSTKALQILHAKHESQAELKAGTSKFAQQRHKTCTSEHRSALGIVNTPQECTNSFGDSTMIEKDINMRKRAKVLPTPVYGFKESASFIKRLLPPVRNGSTGHGRKCVNAPCSDRELESPRKHKSTSNSIENLRTQTASYAQLSMPSSCKRSIVQLESKVVRLKSIDGTGTQFPKRMQQLQQDEGHKDVMVSPQKGNDGHNDNEVADTIPPQQKAWAIPVAMTSKLTIAHHKNDGPEMVPTKFSSSPIESPELTRMPHEFHDLVIDGSAIHRYKGRSSVVIAPVALSSSIIQAQTTHQVNLLSRDPQWVLQTTAQSPIAVLEKGAEDRTVAGSSSPILTALTSKQLYRQRETIGNEDFGRRCVGHLATRGETSDTASLPHTYKLRPRCTCHGYHEGGKHDNILFPDQRRRCHVHQSTNNKWQAMEMHDEKFLLEQKPKVPLSKMEEMTVIVNATRGLVLRPGSMDPLFAKQAKSKQKARRSEMIRRRCQSSNGRALSTC